jgi:hypothetical protein
MYPYIYIYNLYTICLLQPAISWYMFVLTVCANDVDRTQNASCQGEIPPPPSSPNVAPSPLTAVSSVHMHGSSMLLRRH